MLSHRGLLLVLLCGLQAIGAAQTFGPWYALGPFDHPRGADNVDTELPLERSLGRMQAGGIGPDLSASYPGKGSGRVSWKELAGLREGFDVGAIQIASVIDPPPKAAAGWSDNSIAYLYRKIEVSEATRLAARCGSDDGMRLWLNGKLLVDVAAPRALNPSAHQLAFDLEPGANHLLVKVANGGGAWAFQLGPMPDSKVDQEAIERAIDKGAEYLIASQLLDGSWAEYPEYHAGSTAYAAYCLLKTGVPGDHPALQRARAYVLEHASPYTYSTSCELLFLCELGRPEDREAIEERKEALLGFQFKSGLFGYPVHPAGHSHDDLSLTLYAALAMRSLEAHGERVPDVVWERTLQGTLANFEGLQAAEIARGVGAGFRYRYDSPVTGSMTTAGLSVLAIVREALDDGIPQRFRKAYDTSYEAGLRWLHGRMLWGENPGAHADHHYFWLYGVERVGGLLGLSELGGVDWYAEGAGYLLSAQQANGSWGNTVPSVLALLFLKRASAPSTGKKETPPDSWTTGEATADLRLMARGGHRLAVWVQELGEELRTRVLWPSSKGGGLHVARARFEATQVADRTTILLGELTRDPTRPVKENELAVQGELPGRGDWDVVARLLVVHAPSQDGPSLEEELVSPPLRIHVRDTLVPEQLAYARDGIDNLLLGQKYESSTSTKAGDQGPERALDGQQGSAWMCAPDDASPTFTIRLARAAKLRRIALSHGNPRREADGAARASRVRIVLDDKERIEAELVLDPQRKTYVDLGGERRVKSIQVQILDAAHGTLGRASLGFAEIELLGAG